MSPSELVDVLGAEDALEPDVARRLLGVAARLYASALDQGAAPLGPDDLSPTEAVVVATAALRAHLDFRTRKPIHVKSNLLFWFSVIFGKF